MILLNFLFLQPKKSCPCELHPHSQVTLGNAEQKKCNRLAAQADGEGKKLSLTSKASQGLGEKMYCLLLQEMASKGI
jgi:hypothetical protein